MNRKALEEMIKKIRFLVLLVALCCSAVAMAVSDEPESLQGFLTDGTPFDLTQHRGNLVMVPFWATWCPACRAEFPMWQKMYERYRGKGFELVAVSIDRSEEDLGRFQRAHEYTVPMLWRFDERETDSFPSIRRTPTVYFIGPDGTVALIHIGRMSEQQLTENIEVLLPD